MQKLNRYWGFLPILFALYTTIYYIHLGQWAQGLWLCNVLNYILGIALLFYWPFWIWICTLWLLIGTPLWIWEDWLRGDFRIYAFCIHIVSSILGLLALKNSQKKQRVWVSAILFSITLQILCRLITPRELNVNLSFAVYPQLAPYFSSFFSYWLFNTISFIISLFVLEIVLEKMLKTVKI